MDTWRDIRAELADKLQVLCLEYHKLAKQPQGETSQILDIKRDMEIIIEKLVKLRQSVR